MERLGTFWGKNAKNKGLGDPWHPLCVSIGIMRNPAKKILIADGDESFRQSLRKFLSSLRYEVIEAASGTETIEMALTLRPDLIIMDVQLPGLKGDEVTRQLKKNLSTQRIPVVLNTGWTTACNVEERIDRALTAGAAEVLYRPLQLPMLRNVVRSYLSA
jgi:CheY-like chemotaxis protein